MAFTDNTPKLGDTDNNLLMKIAANTAVSAGGGGGGPTNVSIVNPINLGTDLALLVTASQEAADILALSAVTPGVTQYPISSPAGTGQYIVLGSTNRANGPTNFRYSPGDTDFLTGPGTNGAIVNSATGFFGMQITPQGVPITVTQLGRLRLAGNSRSHLLKIVDVSTGLDVQGSQILIDMSVGTPETFNFVTLPAPVVLAAGNPYYILSSETTGGDFWYDGRVVTGTAVATIGQRVYLVDEFVTMAGVQRKDVAGTLVDANGDRTELQVDANGRLRVTSAPEFLDTTPSAATFSTVGVASAQVVAATTARKGLILVNTSINVISLAFGGVAAVLNSGITLGPGDSFQMDDFVFTVSNVNAIASAAGSNLAIQQFI